MKGQRRCLNCAFCERLTLLGGKNVMRCWHEPGVCDHAFVQSIEEAKNYVCDEHRFKEEREKELFNQAKSKYLDHKLALRQLEERYPQLKDLKD